MWQVALFLEKWWVRRVVNLPGGENAVVREPWWERRVVRSPGIFSYLSKAWNMSLFTEMAITSKLMLQIQEIFFLSESQMSELTFGALVSA